MIDTLGNTQSEQQRETSFKLQQFYNIVNGKNNVTSSASQQSDKSMLYVLDDRVACSIEQDGTISKVINLSN